MASLASGSHVIVHREFDAGAVMETIARERVTRTFLVPAMINALLHSGSDADVSSMRSIGYGASPISEAVLTGAQARFGCEHARRCGQEVIRQPLDLAHAGARQQCEHPALRRQGQGGAGVCAVRIQRHLVGQRMSDEARVHPMPRIDRRLHREQAQHEIRAAADLRRAPLAPGPDRRADVVHGLDAGAAQFEFEAKVEIRRIDTDEHIRLGGYQITRQLTAAAKQLEQAAEHLDQAHDRQAFHGEIGAQPLGFHQRATDPDEPHLRVARLECTHQTGAQNVAAGLARNQRYAEFGHISG